MATIIDSRQRENAFSLLPSNQRMDAVLLRVGFRNTKISIII
ncbi:hypothetical protein BFGS084_01379 [Bacteroides fragilis]|nr:hypothetical protein BFGS084_01379 [Bacteroides fragilis]